jgi:hypothetical protein
MKSRKIFSAVLFMALAWASSAVVAAEGKQDSKAIDVLNQMAAYTKSLDQMTIKGEVFADARLDAGLIISNPSEISLKIDRPGSLYLKSFDGINTQEIYIREEKLTIFNSEKNFYASSEVPAKIEDAMQFAIDKLDLDVPLGELFFADSALALLTDQDTLLYLTDKSRIRGVDCHHIAIRGDDFDLQLWIEEGDRPVPRKMLVTMKWEGGSPRRAALMEIKATSGLDPKIFEFKPPEGAQEIRFVGSD